MNRFDQVWQQTAAPAARPSSSGVQAAQLRNLRAAVILGLTLCLAAGLGWYDIGAQSAWMDELMSLRYSAGHTLAQTGSDLPMNTPVADPPHLTKIHDRLAWTGTLTGLDTHPPLYFVLLRLWRTAFGESDAAARSLSLLAFVATVALVYAVARHMYDADGTEIWAALITAMAGPAIYYAQEARPYALSLPLGLGAAWAVVRLERHGWTFSRGMALGLCVLALCLSLYLGVVVAFALGLYAVLRLRGTALRGAVIVLVAAATVYLVTWGPFLYKQRRTLVETTTWLKESPRGHVERSVARLATLPVSLIDQGWVNVPSREPAWRYACELAGVLLLVAPAVLIAIRRDARRDLLLWYLWFVCAVAMPLLLDIVQSKQYLHWLRFTLLAGPALYILIAAIGRRVARRQPYVRHVLPALAVLLCAGGLAAARPYRPTKPPYRDLAEVINHHYQPGDALVIAGFGAESYRAYYEYVGVARYLDRVPAPLVVLTQPPGPDVAAALRDGRRIWMVLMRSTDTPQRILPGATSTTGQPLHESIAGRLYLAHWPARTTP